MGLESSMESICSRCEAAVFHVKRGHSVLFATGQMISVYLSHWGRNNGPCGPQGHKRGDPLCRGSLLVTVTHALSFGFCCRLLA